MYIISMSEAFVIFNVFVVTSVLQLMAHYCFLINVWRDIDMF